MIRELYSKIKNKQDLRANLISLKQELKDKNVQREFAYMTGGNYDVIMKCLAEDDAKIRKNAANILGILRCQEALDVLMDAYEVEEQLFVKPDYIKAMAQLDCKEYLTDFKHRFDMLNKMETDESSKKHVQAELKELQKLILAHDTTVKKHTFTGYDREHTVILTTLKSLRDVTADQLPEGSYTLMAGGIKVNSDSLRDIFKIRTFKEMIFVLEYKKELTNDPADIANVLLESNLMQILEDNHKENTPFYFRLGLVSSMPLEERSVFLKKIAENLEKGSGRQLINTPSHYEIEIRLIQNKSGGFYPCLKLYTIPDTRFTYRKHYVASSMQPYIAAGIMELARPYLKEHAQVLDPFCGVGTLLIERSFLMPARSSYGIDIFGEAIAKARANTEIVGMPIHYINRNFEDFRHEYEFDEIITDMPFNKNGRAEQEKLYQILFDKSTQLLTNGGYMIIYTRESAMVRQQLRIQRQYHLIEAICLNESKQNYLFIIKFDKTQLFH